MLGDRVRANLVKKNKNIFETDLIFNFSSLRNLNSYLQRINDTRDAFSYIDDYLSEKDDIKKTEYITTIIYCIFDASKKIDSIYDIVNEYLEELDIVMTALLNREIHEENLGIDEEIKKSESKFNFEIYWNTMYATAITQLNMSEEEFLKSSPREIMTLEKFNNNYLVNILIKKEIELIEASKKARELKEKEDIEGTIRDPHYFQKLDAILV